MLTYFDVVEHLITASFGGPQDAEQRDIRTAVQRAYSEVTQIRDWAYYHVHGRIITSLPYSTGAVTVSNNTATLVGGEWPTWAASGGYLRIGEEICRVAARLSSVQLTLDSAIRLKANVSSQPYTLYRTVYSLPSDFRNLDEPSDEYNWWSGLYLTPDQAMKLERVGNSSGEPYHWTIIRDPSPPPPSQSNLGAAVGWAIKLLGYPTKVETIDFTYRRSARDLRLSGHEPDSRVGTIELLPDGVVTGANTNFSSTMTGSVLRVGTTATHPGVPESLTPYGVEVVIRSVADFENLMADEGFSAPALSKYIITDPIDLPAHMRNVMYSAAEYWLARIRNQKPDNAFAMYQRDLRLAMEMDQLAPLSGRSREIWHDGGWRSPLKPDQGT
jgi:hypothetical protein